MIRNWTKSSTRRNKTALTLIEVVAGIALMASLITSMLWTKDRFAHSANQAQRRLQALAAADRLLSQWWQKPELFPRDREGAIDSSQTLRWRTYLIANSTVAKLRSQIVRLEIIEQQALPDSTAPLAVVDIVLPAEEKRRD